MSRRIGHYDRLQSLNKISDSGEVYSICKCGCGRKFIPDNLGGRQQIYYSIKCNNKMQKLKKKLKLQEQHERN